MKKTLQILAKVVDWNDNEESFLSPSLDDAVAGLHTIIDAAFVHEVKTDKSTTNADKVEVRLYKVDTEETGDGIKVTGTSVKLFEGKFQFWPRRIKGVPLTREEEVVEEKKLVELN